MNYTVKSTGGARQAFDRLSRREHAVTITLAVGLLLLITAAPVTAQVFPGEERLDVVRLTDGTVLRGIITERIPDQYVEIELWGGSTFVLGVDSIEAIEQEENPDFGTVWIMVEIGAPESETPDDPDPPVIELSDTRSLRRRGHSFGLYGMIGLSWLTGEDYEDWIDGIEGDVTEKPAGSTGLGAAWSWLTPFNPDYRSPWIWGLRGSVGYASLAFDVVVERSEEIGGDAEYLIDASLVRMPLEVLSGIAYDRVALLAGIGPALGILIDDSELSRDLQTLETGRELSFMWVASLSGLLRLGRSWILEARLETDGQFTPWTTEDFRYQTWSGGLGIRYRL